jgi:hypothetical protein
MSHLFASIGNEKSQDPQRWLFYKVPAGGARNEMGFVVYIDTKEVVSDSVPKTDPRPAPELHFKRRDDKASQ